MWQFLGVSFPQDGRPRNRTESDVSINASARQPNPSNTKYIWTLHYRSWWYIENLPNKLWSTILPQCCEKLYVGGIVCTLSVVTRRWTISSWFISTVRMVLQMDTNNLLVTCVCVSSVVPLQTLELEPGVLQISLLSSSRRLFSHQIICQKSAIELQETSCSWGWQHCQCLAKRGRSCMTILMAPRMNSTT